MKKIAIILAVAVCLLATSAHAIDPPKGLKWGMSSDSVTVRLKAKYDEKVVKSTKNGNIILTVGDTKLSGFEGVEAQLHFNRANELYQFLYLLSKDNDINGQGRRKVWGLFAKMQKALLHKYGEPVTNTVTDGVIGSTILPDNSYLTGWSTDSTSLYIGVTRTLETSSPFTDNLLLIAMYKSTAYDTDEKPSFKDDDL